MKLKEFIKMADPRRQNILGKPKTVCCTREKKYVFKKYGGRSKIQEPDLRGSFSQICDNFNV